MRWEKCCGEVSPRMGAEWRNSESVVIVRIGCAAVGGWLLRLFGLSRPCGSVREAVRASHRGTRAEEYALSRGAGSASRFGTPRACGGKVHAAKSRRSTLREPCPGKRRVGRRIAGRREAGLSREKRADAAAGQSLPAGKAPEGAQGRTYLVRPSSSISKMSVLFGPMLPGPLAP